MNDEVKPISGETMYDLFCGISLELLGDKIFYSIHLWDAPTLYTTTREYAELPCEV